MHAPLTHDSRHVAGTGISSEHSLAPVCDVLRAELRDVNDQTESAATLFIGRLDNIDGVVNQLGAEVGGLVGLAENRADHMEVLVTKNSEVVNQVTGFLTDRDEAIRALIDEVRDLQRFAESVRDIVRISRILALNARIESAHAGEIGRGFAIIAQEMLALAGQSDQAARDITNGIAHLTKKMSETLGDHDLAGHMSQISDANDELFGAFKTATSEVGGVAQNVQSHVEILGHFTTELAGAMQFQDIARQQVEHVIAGLDSVEKHSELLIGHVRGEVPVEKVLEGVTMLDKIFDGYVMERQRHVHHQAVGDYGPTTGGGPAIELF